MHRFCGLKLADSVFSGLRRACFDRVVRHVEAYESHAAVDHQKVNSAGMPTPIVADGDAAGGQVVRWD